MFVWGLTNVVYWTVKLAHTWYLSEAGIFLAMVLRTFFSLTTSSNMKSVSSISCHFVHYWLATIVPGPAQQHVWPEHGPAGTPAPDELQPCTPQGQCPAHTARGEWHMVQMFHVHRKRLDVFTCSAGSYCAWASCCCHAVDPICSCSPVSGTDKFYS